VNPFFFFLIFLKTKKNTIEKNRIESFEFFSNGQKFTFQKKFFFEIFKISKIAFYIDKKMKIWYFIFTTIKKE